MSDDRKDKFKKILIFLKSEFDKNPTGFVGDTLIAQFCNLDEIETRGLLIQMEEEQLVQAVEKTVTVWFWRIRKKGIDELEKKEKIIVTGPTPRPLYIPPGAFTISHTESEDRMFGTPVYVKMDKKNKIKDHWNMHKYHLWLPVILFLLSIPIIVIVDDYTVSKIESTITGKPFLANLTSVIDQPVTINLALNGDPYTKVNISIQGVVPDPGVITVRLSNYTLNPQHYNASEIELDGLSLQKNEQIPVTPNQPIQQSITITLVPSVRFSPDYAHKDPKINNESFIGTITFSADYYDQITKTTKSYLVTSPLKASMLGYPVGY